MRATRPAILFVFLLASGGCEDGFGPRPRDPDYSEPMVNAFLIKTQYYDYSVEYSRYVEVFDNHGLRMVPVATLNRETLTTFYYTPTEYRYGDEVPFAVNARYSLAVEHYWGRAFSHVVMPGDFTINSPPERYIMDLESTLVVAWQRSDEAQWYWFSLYIAYDFNDSFGRWGDYEFELDTAVTDTFVRIYPWRVFPNYVADVLEGDASAIVWSGNGPAVEPGDMGNIRGNGFGFYNATNEPREKYFYVGAPPDDRRAPEPSSRRSRFLERLLGRARLRPD